MLNFIYKSVIFTSIILFPIENKGSLTLFMFIYFFYENMKSIKLIFQNHIPKTIFNSLILSCQNTTNDVMLMRKIKKRITNKNKYVINIFIQQVKELENFTKETLVDHIELYTKIKELDMSFNQILLNTAVKKHNSLIKIYNNVIHNLDTTINTNNDSNTKLFAHNYMMAR